MTFVASSQRCSSDCSIRNEAVSSERSALSLPSRMARLIWELGTALSVGRLRLA